MDSEKDVERRIAQYQELAKEDKKVDAAALMIDALEQKRQDEVSARAKYWAYLVSAGLPPFGLFFALYHFMSGKSDGKKVALICVILTVVTSVLSWLLLRQVISSLGVTDASQIQDRLNDYKELLQ